MLRSLVELLFPRCCPNCGQPPARTGGRLCAACLATVVPLKGPLCRWCGVPVPGQTLAGHLCGECLRRPPPFALARAVVGYQGAPRQLIHRLKYGGDRVALPAIREIIAAYDLREFLDCHLIVPVPLHRQRLRRRGLNQALELARLFFPGRREAIAVDWLVRVKDTVPQTGLDGAARRRNLRGAFQLGPARQAAGAVVCLVDDVYTTGTTVGACSRVLLAGNIREVKVLTLARVERGRSLGEKK
jgi:ComF family protein